MVVTNHEYLANRLRLIRNHAEACVGDMGHPVDDLTNMVGFNFRMGEMEAALALEQIKLLPNIGHSRRMNAAYLTEHLGIPGITPPYVEPGVEHGYYLYAMKYDAAQFKGLHRNEFVKAVQAEGVPLVAGYVKPIYLEPLFQNRIAFGSYPFDLRPDITYEPGLCPVAERMYYTELMYSDIVHDRYEPDALQDFIRAMHKVADNLDELL